jgi:hypothetical protein
MRSCRTLVRALVPATLVTLLAVSLATAAVGGPQQVLGDYADDGQIQGNYSLADLRGALKLRAADPQYGAYRELVQERIDSIILGAGPRMPKGQQRSDEHASAGTHVQSQAQIALPALPTPAPSEPGEGPPLAFVVMSGLAGVLALSGGSIAVYRRLRR